MILWDVCYVVYLKVYDIQEPSSDCRKIDIE